MENALNNVKKLGSEHREEFVEKVKGAYSEINGAEPTQKQIAVIL